MFVLHLLSHLSAVMDGGTFTFTSDLEDPCFISLTSSIIVFIYDYILNDLLSFYLVLGIAAPVELSIIYIRSSDILSTPTTNLDMQRSARTPAFFRDSQLAFRSLRWKPKWNPPPHFVALMNEDEDLDLVVVSTFDSLDVCCHEELLKTPISGLLRLIVDLNSRLSVAMKIRDSLTKSEDQLRMDIEAVLGYKRFPRAELEVSAMPSRDSGLGLLGILSASQAPDAQAVPSTSSRVLRQKDSNGSLGDRQRLTVSMRGKPRLADLVEEEPETGNPAQLKEISPIRRSDRQRSFTQGCHQGEAATLPRARNLRNFHAYEGRKVRLNFS